MITEEILTRVANDLFDMLPRLASTAESRLQVTQTVPQHPIFHPDGAPGCFSFEYKDKKIKLQYCTTKNVSHGITVWRNEQQIDLWLEVRGWVHLRVDEKEVYSQRLLAERGAGWHDDFTGDRERFVELAKEFNQIEEELKTIAEGGLTTARTRTGNSTALHCQPVMRNVRRVGG